MGLKDYFSKFEKNLDDDYKKSDVLIKFIQRHSPKVIAAGIAIAALAAPFLISGYYSAKQNCRQQLKNEARQEVLQYKIECEQELIKQKNELDAGKEQLDNQREELRKRAHELTLKSIEVDSAGRIAEFDQRYLKIKEQLIEIKQDFIASQLDKRERMLDAKAASLRETEKKLEGMLIKIAKESLPFYSSKPE